jgi:hypothetical protein
VALTSDGYTKIMTQLQNYLLQNLKFLISCLKFEEAHHTGVNIMNMLDDVIKEWDIGSKLICITTDYAIEIRHENLDSLSCAAHTIQLAIGVIF